MTLEAVSSEPVSTPSSTKKRPERLQDGTLILTHQLPLGVKISLRVQSALGRVKIYHQPNAREHIAEEEKRYFKDIPDLENWPTKGIIEVWTPTTTPGEYTVVEYQKLK